MTIHEWALEANRTCGNAVIICRIGLRACARSLWPTQGPVLVDLLYFMLFYCTIGNREIEGLAIPVRYTLSFKCC